MEKLNEFLSSYKGIVIMKHLGEEEYSYETVDGTLIARRDGESYWICLPQE